MFESLACTQGIDLLHFYYPSHSLICNPLKKRIVFDVILNLIQKDNMQIKSELFIYFYTQSKHLPITLSGGKTCMSNSK